MAETTHRWIVEMIGSGIARVEVDGKQMMSLPVSLLPFGVREGDVLAVEHNRRPSRSSISMVLDPEAKAKLLEESRRQGMARSKNDTPGDVTL